MNQSINTDSKKSKEPQQKYRLGTVSIKILGGLNRFYRRPTSPSASIMAQNIQLFGPRGGFLTHQPVFLWPLSVDDVQLSTRFEPDHEKMCLMSYAYNKGADQPAHPHSVISAFIVRCLDSII